MIKQMRQSARKVDPRVMFRLMTTTAEMRASGLETDPTSRREQAGRCVSGRDCANNRSAVVADLDLTEHD